MKHLIAFLWGAAASCFFSFAAPVGVLSPALDDSAWDVSEWISAADAPVVTGIVTDKNIRAADGASWFVCSVQRERKIISVKWMTAGLGVYQLYVNGQRIGEEVLKPGFTHPFRTKLSFTYDITDAVMKRAGATNVFSAQVTPGWWADKILTPNKNEGMRGRKCAFRSVLEIRYTDGTVERIGTDRTHWKAGIAGPVTHAAIFDGEEYDARIRPGYETPERLGVPERNDEFSGVIVPTDGAEVYHREDLALDPVLAYVWKGVEGESEEAYGTVVRLREYTPGKKIRLSPGETLVIDFGQNAAAVPDFVFKAEAGTVLTCLPAEILNDGNGLKSRGMDGPDGSVHRLNLRTPEQGMILRYTFGGGRGYASYRPLCTFFGYRFVSITADGDVTIKRIRSIPVSSIRADMETGWIRTGHEGVNQLLSNARWGQLSNYLSVPTDCPQRNERLGWSADTQVFAETGTFFADTRAFLHKWMRDERDTQMPSGAFGGVAPLAQAGTLPHSLSRLGWADAGIIVPWIVWKQFGDREIIEENWEAMKRFVDHVAAVNYDHTSLAEENGNYQWGDWLSYEALESKGRGIYDRDENGKRFIRPEAIEYWNYLSACYLCMDAEMMRDMAAASGRDAEPYRELAERMRAFIRERFFTEDGLCFRTQTLNTMQTPALFALKARLWEGAARDAIIARLRANFAEHGNCLQTGFLGTSILMQTLTENGMADIAWELLFQRKNPSWLYSVDNGATTIWERWNSYTIESGLGPKDMNSFNHYAYGCVCEWIFETAAGIAADPACPGFRHIVMKPLPDRRLGHLEAQYRSAAGLIKSAWRYDGDSWIWDFTIPEGATASVTLPGSDESEEYPAGTYHKTVKL